MAKTVVNIDVQVESKSVADLEKELSAINDELKSVKIGSDRFKELSKDAQQLTGQLEKVNKEIEGFTLDKKIETSQAAVLGLAGGLEATVGTLGLLGVESEVFGAFEEKAISALTAARGFIDLSEGFGKLAKNISFATIKSKIFGITTKQALIATGIGAFAVILGSIIAYWDDINKAVDKAAEKFPILGIVIKKVEDGFNALIETFRPVLEFFGILPDAAERANNAIIEGNEKVIAANEKEIDILRAKGATQEEIYAKQEELLMAELDNLKRTDAEKEDIESKAHELTLLRITEESRKRKEAFDQRLKQIQLSETLEKERVELEKEWFANFGDESAMSFVQAFNETVKEEFEFIDPEYIDETFDEIEEDLFKTVDNYQKGLQDALDKTILNGDNWNQFFDLANNAFDSIANLSQQRYDRTLLNLQRERDEIVNNVHLTEEERSAALARLEKKEKAAEVRRIKAERDQFTLKQTLLGLEAIMKAKNYAMEQIQIAKLNVAKATATAQEIALAGTAAIGKASMSIGAFVAALGPFGIAAFAATIGGVIASIIAARKQAKAQIAAIGGMSGGGGAQAGAAPPSNIASAGLANLTDTGAPQFSGAQPAIRTFVLAGDVTSSQEADAKLNRKRRVG
jgi:hypothetical protein